MDGPIIELAELGKSYGTVRALEGISFRVERGEIFGYVGANGAGKSTTIKILAGLIRPTSGDARVAGYSVISDPLEVKARIGYVPESGAIFEKLTPAEYLGSVGLLHMMPRPEITRRTAELLEFFGLSSRADVRMDVFSKGMKQKICIAAALLHDPEVVFLDEPLNGLDVEAVHQFKELLKSLAAEGRTIFYTSHLMDVVERICTRLAVIDKGRLVDTGTPDELRARTQSSSLEQALMRLWGRDPSASLSSDLSAQPSSPPPRTEPELS